MKTKALFHVGYQIVYTVICITLLVDLFFDIKIVKMGLISLTGNILSVTPSLFKGGIVIIGKILEKLF